MTRVIDGFSLKDEEFEQPFERKTGVTKVLVVTQNADFRTRVSDELAAVLVAKTSPPHHVIISLTIPDLESSDVIARLATSEHRPQVIAVHDEPTEDIRTSARSAGARMCRPPRGLIQPSSRRITLLAAINAQTTGYPGSAPASSFASNSSIASWGAPQLPSD